MLVMSFISNLLLTMGGITIFLHGLKLLSNNMQALAGGRMKKLLSAATSSRLKGVAAGAIATAAVQSSTATGIMLAGFVNAGALSVYQAVPVIMGANVGTTVTAQLVSLSGSDLFDVTALGSLVAFVGFLFTFSSKRPLNLTGNAMLGFGIVFIGLEMMNASIYAFRSYAFFRRLFMAENPFVLILNGFLITGIVQSSSAVSSVMIILALNGLITFENSAYLILGTNIGAGLAVLFVSSNMSGEARKVAIANLMFNIVGACIFIVPMLVFEERIAGFFAAISGSIERQVANFHTVFNLSVTLVLLPFNKVFVRAVDAIGDFNLKFRLFRRGGRGAGMTHTSR